MPDLKEMSDEELIDTFIFNIQGEYTEEGFTQRQEILTRMARGKGKVHVGM